MMSLDCTLAISVGNFLLAESVFWDYMVRTGNNDSNRSDSINNSWFWCYIGDELASELSCYNWMFLLKEATFIKFKEFDIIFVESIESFHLV